MPGNCSTGNNSTAIMLAKSKPKGNQCDKNNAGSPGLSTFYLSTFQTPP